MEHHPPSEQTPGESSTPPEPRPRTGGFAVTRLPVPNAIAAVIIAVAAVLGGITVLLVMPDLLQGLGGAVTITGPGFALAAKVAVPR